MDKVVLIIPDNNKGKFIAKGYSSAFKELSYFVIEKKVYDINVDEIHKISPHVVFICWVDIAQKDVIYNFIENYNNEETIFIHVAEYIDEIPEEYNNKNNHFLFANDSKTHDRKIKTGIAASDYKSKFSGYKYNITFAGNPATSHREKLLSKLIYNFGPINIFCRSFDFYKSLEEIQEKNLLNEYFAELYKQSYKGYVESQKELSDIFISSKINLDFESIFQKDINFRCLEILAAGGFLISEYNENLVKYFDEGKELEVFETDDDLIDKINFYLGNLNLAQMIAVKGRRNAVNNFSYTDILKSILKVVYGEDISS